jgi:CRP-like cAMP-binding protein
VPTVREFVVILDGIAEVFKQDVLVATLDRGDFFGEIALLTGEPRTATVVAVTPVVVLVLAGHQFRMLMERVTGMRTTVEAVLPLRLAS